MPKRTSTDTEEKQFAHRKRELAFFLSSALYHERLTVDELAAKTAAEGRGISARRIKQFLTGDGNDVDFRDVAVLETALGRSLWEMSPVRRDYPSGGDVAMNIQTAMSIGTDSLYEILKGDAEDPHATPDQMANALPGVLLAAEVYLGQVALVLGWPEYHVQGILDHLAWAIKMNKGVKTEQKEG